jgi:hypothetical protein
MNKLAYELGTQIAIQQLKKIACIQDPFEKEAAWKDWVKNLGLSGALATILHAAPADAGMMDLVAKNLSSSPAMAKILEHTGGVPHATRLGRGAGTHGLEGLGQASPELAQATNLPSLAKELPSKAKSLKHKSKAYKKQLQQSQQPQSIIKGPLSIMEQQPQQVAKTLPQNLEGQSGFKLPSLIEEAGAADQVPQELIGLKTREAMPAIEPQKPIAIEPKREPAIEPNKESVVAPKKEPVTTTPSKEEPIQAPVGAMPQQVGAMQNQVPTQVGQSQLGATPQQVPTAPQQVPATMEQTPPWWLLGAPIGAGSGYYAGQKLNEAPNEKYLYGLGGLGTGAAISYAPTLMNHLQNMQQNKGELK